VRQKANVYRQRLELNFRAMFALRATLASATIGPGARTWTASISFRAVFPPIGLPRAALIPIPVPAARPVGPPLTGIRVLALKISVVIAPRRLVGPGGQHFQV
jgi:hypothetical protein